MVLVFFFFLFFVVFFFNDTATTEIYTLSLHDALPIFDSDYRGEVGVIILNTSDVPFEVSHGMRIAQMVLAPVVQAAFEEASSLDETTRGAGGFGSTGRG